MKRPSRSKFAPLWLLDETVTFLNHGSFGATPRAILEHQTKLRERIEREPVLFFAKELEGLLDEAKRGLGAFVGAPADDIAFVPNATTGVNAVLRSIPIPRGAELLVTDHEYNACKNALDFAAERAGASVKVVPIPFPLRDEAQVVECIVSAITPKTHLLLIDHITSPTALVLPVERIVRECQARGVDVLVDGAHSPGMVPLALKTLGAAYYTANCHKWLCAPKGAAFLYVRPDRQRDVRPTTISHGANSTRTDRSRYQIEFDWTGTLDPTPYLCVPESIRFLESLLPGGFSALVDHNRESALSARKKLAAELALSLPCPDSMIGSMAALVLPDGHATVPSPLYGDPLQDLLFDKYRIEVPVVPWPAPPSRIVRLAPQIYSSPEEIDFLADALKTELSAEGAR